MKTGINILFTFFLGLLILGCNNNEGEKKGGGIYENPDAKGAETTTEAPKSQGTTSIQFEETEFDFGTIDEGTIVTHSFKFKNTGTVPLIISDSRADCGCTVPNPPKEPILPGKESQIEVKFNSSGKGGQTVNKTVTVLANTEPSDSKIQIKGKIKGKDEGSPLKK